ncbi:TniQ family protein [Meridianimarinicoccus sp. RP-17]|uniref:TniQ family protein n=1 Tax=Meridianimarinicoccus zhengii TaxID=2056810 RepID=UPI000DAEC50E|nr:TniQ family protein [Phycocomes zhengii]
MIFLLAAVEVPDMIPILFPFLAFDVLETPLSFAARLADLHTGGHPLGFLKDMGIDPLALAAGHAAALDRLCDVARVDHGLLRHNAVQRITRRRHALRGEVLSSGFFSSPHTVFCPGCLRADDAAGHGRRGRLAWTLRPVRTCPEHGLALVERARVKWDDRFHEMDACVPERGAELDALVASCARQTVSPLQSYVTRRLDGHAGPSWLDSQTLEQTVRATEILGALLAFGPERRRRSFTSSEWEEAGRIGYAFTSEGARGIGAALDEARKAADSTRKPGRLTMFGCLYEWLSSTKPQSDPGDIKRILRGYIFDTFDVDAGVPVLGAALDLRRLHSVESLAREKDVDPRTLRNLLVASGLVSKSDDDTGYQVFDADAGRKIAAQLRRSVTMTALPGVLNCTRPQANRILDERLLTPLSDGADTAPGRARKSVDSAEIDAFLATLHARARPVDSIPADLEPLAKVAERAKIGCGEIVQMIIAGFLDTVVRDRNIPGLAGVHVDRKEVRARMATCLPGVSPTTAFGELSIPIAVGWALADSKDALHLPSIDIEGPTGHRFTRFREADIAAFMSRFTTVVRIAHALGMQKDRLAARLKAARVKPVAASLDVGLAFYLVEDLPAWSNPLPDMISKVVRPIPNGEPFSHGPGLTELWSAGVT